MKIKSLAVLAASVTLALAACGTKKKMRPHSARKVTPAQKPGPQKIDECPAAEGQWTLGSGETVTIGRKEGFLTVQHADLSEAIVMDGQSRKIKQASTGAEPEVSGDCSKQLIKITYKSEGKTVAQSWNIDLEKDIVVITETEGATVRSIQGTRLYSKPE